MVAGLPASNASAHDPTKPKQPEYHAISTYVSLPLSAGLAEPVAGTHGPSLFGGFGGGRNPSRRNVSPRVSTVVGSPPSAELRGFASRCRNASQVVTDTVVSIRRQSGERLEALLRRGRSFSCFGAFAYADRDDAAEVRARMTPPHTSILN
jgi:hypothetical protein